ncbi:pilus assembly protein [Aromatoleum toluclasticum]|uniref:pilus assembly protein n=1 Tax=Aromatoleum toluclasticum TaxID=92003 RepID=UPI0003736CB0|nr:PilC/PilY family type IV pilus protein [Aromatoleum toluclasticum]
MSKRLHFTLALASLGIGISAPIHAEDIDIYTAPPNALAAPNVLLVLDNTSNWAATDQQWTYTGAKSKCGTDTECLRYVEAVFAGITSGPVTQGEVEARTLKVVLDEVVCSAAEPLPVNMGLMMLSDGGTAAPGNEKGVGAYIRRAIQFLGPTTEGLAGCANLKGELTDIYQNITAPRNKIQSSGDYGAAMFEAFKYFGGYARTQGIAATVGGTPTDATHFGPIRYSALDPKNFPTDRAAFTSDAMTTYASPLATNSCGKNYIVFIGNAFPKEDFGTDKKVSPPSNILLKNLGLTPSQLPEANDPNNIRFADEWAQFLARTDVSELSGYQPLKTFTIDVFNAKEDKAETALLNSMAKHGGTGAGGAFIVNGNIKALVDAIKTILTQISAVNSAFASASLPISVNTQGTYLNQVFIGMFRPAENGFPRWAGNLKQYQFALRETTSGGVISRTLFLADAKNDPAIDNANTGFINGCARSFWTKDSSPLTYWQTVSGAERNIPEGSCPSSSDENAVHNDSPDGWVVERGGNAQRLRSIGSASSRTIATCAPAPSNCDSTTATTFTPSTADGNWIQGANTGDGYNLSTPIADTEQYGKTSTEVRPTVHGGVIHSRPLAINYGSGTSDAVVVFYGGDDGFLRAIDGNKDGKSTNGNELWAFLAPEFSAVNPATGKSRLARSRDNYPQITFADDPTAPKDYFFDGSIGAYIGPQNADGTGSRVTYIYPAMRRGGRMIYAFDATKNPATSAPIPMWRFGCDNFGKCFGGDDAAKLGQTWSAPRVIRVKNQTTLYTVFGGGYDSCEDKQPRDCTSSSPGAGIFVLNAKTGEKLRHIALGNGRVTADLVPIDTDGDGYSDLIYAADTSGNLWRVNLRDPSDASTSQNQDNWTVTQVAKVGEWSSTSNGNERKRKFLFAPDVVQVGKYNVVLIGSGDREKPLLKSEATTVRNRFYGFWDEYGVIGSGGTGRQKFPIDDSADCDVAGDTRVSANCDDTLNLLNTTDTTLDYLPIFSVEATRPRGWVIDLTVTASGQPWEQVVTTPATVGGLVNFSTFQANNPNSCSSLGIARGYAACFIHGGATCGTPSPDGAERSAEFVGGGMAPSPVTGTVVVDGKIVPFIIGGKPEGTGSALEAKLPPIPIKKDRTKVYRYKKID